MENQPNQSNKSWLHLQNMPRQQKERWGGEKGMPFDLNCYKANQKKG